MYDFISVTARSSFHFVMNEQWGERERNTVEITTLSFILDYYVLTTRLGCKVEEVILRE